MLSGASACSAKDSLSFFEDDLSLDGSPLGEDDGAVPSSEPPVMGHLLVEQQGTEPGQWEESRSLHERLRELAFEDEHSDAPDGCLVTALLQLRNEPGGCAPAGSCRQQCKAASLRKLMP